MFWKKKTQIPLFKAWIFDIIDMIETLNWINIKFNLHKITNNNNNKRKQDASPKKKKIAKMLI